MAEEAPAPKQPKVSDTTVMDGITMVQQAGLTAAVASAAGLPIGTGDTPTIVQSSAASSSHGLAPSTLQQQFDAAAGATHVEASSATAPGRNSSVSSFYIGGQGKSRSQGECPGNWEELTMGIRHAPTHIIPREPPQHGPTHDEYHK